MYHLFLCFLRLPTNNIYLVINICDIIFGLIRSGLLGFSFLVTYTVIDDSVQTLLQVLLMIVAIFALIQYISKRYYRTKVHMFYMVTRAFISILYSIIVAMAIVNFLQNIKHYKKQLGKHLFNYGLIGTIQFFDLYWSYLLLKIIH